MITRRCATVCAFLLSLSSGLAFCQDRSTEQRYELFGGVSALGAQTPYTRHVEGWNGSVTIKVRNQLGIFFSSAGYYYGADDVNACAVHPCKLGRDSYDILLGPVFRPAMLERLRLRPFVRGIVGGVYLTGHDLVGPPILPASAPYPQRELNFAIGAGGGIDFALSKRVNLRVIQLDYVRRVGGRLYWFESGMVRPSTGVVVRF